MRQIGAGEVEGDYGFTTNKSMKKYDCNALFSNKLKL